MVMLIVTCSAALSIIENKYFKEFVCLLNSKYNICTRFKLRNLLIPKCVKELLDKIIAELAKAPFIAQTVDAWTDYWQKSFLAVTAHFIDENWKPKSYLLQYRRFFGSHCATNIASEYEKIASKFKISD